MGLSKGESVVIPSVHGIQRASLPQQIADRIQEQVIARRSVVGERLPSERDLADQYAVSRPVVREALQLLGARGLITVRQGAGAFVREATLAGSGNPIEVTLRRRSAERPLWELYEVRRTLEVELAGLAAERATPDQIQDMHDAVVGLVGIDVEEEYVDLDLAFHRVIAEASANDMFVVLLEPIAGLLREFRHIAFRRDREAAVVTAEREHRRILDAIERRDPDAAREAMRRHVEAAQWVYAAPLGRTLPHPDANR